MAGLIRDGVVGVSGGLVLAAVWIAGYLTIWRACA